MTPARTSARGGIPKLDRVDWKPGTRPRAGTAALPFRRLDADVPLLLLPIRLETVFDLDASGAGTLRIRVFPDQLSVDALLRPLSEREIELGEAYWKGRKADPDGARDLLVAELGVRRAAWVARSLDPRRDASSEVEWAEVEQPARARGLPDRWVFVGYRGGKELFREFGGRIPADLQVTPDPAAPPWSKAPHGMPIDAGVAWTIDFAEAIRRGMAISIDAAKLAGTARLDTLLVFGISTGSPDAAADELESLLVSHRFSGGLDLLAQGTPTNNTEEVTTPWSSGEDAAALFEAEVDGRGGMEKASDAHRLVSALGLGKESILGRLPSAGLAEAAAAGAMNEALWPATLGEFLTGPMRKTDGSAAITAAVQRFLRPWFIDRVRAAGPLPTLRIGPQPYGILPARVPLNADSLDGSTGYLEDLLRLLREGWRAGLANVPRLDPDLVDTGGSEVNATDSELAAMLGAQPHPWAFAVRRWRNRRDDGIIPLLSRLSSLVGGYEFLLDALSDQNLYSGFGQVYDLVARNVDTLDEQIEAYDFLYDFVDDFFPRGDERIGRARTLIDFIRNSVLENHRSRQEPIAGLSGVSASGVLGDDVHDPILFYLQGEREPRIWNPDEHPLVQAADAAEGETAADYLTVLARRARWKVRSRGAEPSMPDSFAGREPLLYQLVANAIDSGSLKRGELTGYARSLLQLARLDPAELELRMRETLGLVTHRLDAWFTSLDYARLGELRETKPAGIQLGAFGWVTDLEPSDRQGSQGFIHTPSLQHAATAAILRSGWSAHGTDSDDSPYAVDLSSARMRQAEQALDAVRQGQELGDVLGYRFERALHDDPRGLDSHIDPARRAVLKSEGDRSDPTGPVDGLKLFQLYREGKLPTSLTDVAGVTEALDGLGDLIDAIADAGLAEAVHQLAMGNTERASAAIDGISNGALQPPELRSLRTPRAGTGVEHRAIVLLAEPDPALAWAVTPRSTAATRVDGWLTDLLGPASEIGCTAFASQDGAEVSAPLTMVDLGIAAIDAVLEAPAAESGGRWAARARLAAADRLGPTDPGTIRVDGSLAGGAAICFDDAAELARTLRDLLAAARPLRAADLATGGTETTSTRDVADLRDRARGLVTDAGEVLAAAEAEQDWTAADLRELLGRLALAGDAAALPVEAVDVTDVAALREMAGAAAARLRARLDAAGELDASLDVGDDADIAAVARTLTELVAGRDLPLIPTFRAEGADEFFDAVASGDALLQGRPGEPMEWLGEVARVRPDLARLADAFGLAEMLRDGFVASAGVAQLPAAAGDGWAARTAPVPDSGGRTAFLIAGDRAPAAGVSGLALDAWAERIPAGEQTTGIALHFDAPSTRPPQTVLLAVPPEGEGWSLELIAETLLHTLEQAMLRTVDPSSLDLWRQSIPLTYVPGVLAAGTQPETD